MADKKIMIAVGVVAVVAVVAVAAFFLMNNSSSDDETYYFYINYGDNEAKTGWYTASGSDVDAALEKSVKDKGITVTYSKYGYPNFDDGTWGVFNFTWDQCNTTTADESISSPSYGAYGDFIKSNGWDSFAGYGDGAKKMNQSDSTVFYFAKYDPLTYDIVDPVECKLWKNASGSPFAKGVDYGGKTTFYFFIDFGDNDTKTGWYSAKASNADEALASAVKDKEGITLGYSKYGYPNFDNGTWGVFNYTWADRTVTAASESISSPSYGAYGDFIKSNGWDSFAGYGNAEKKMYQSMSEIFFFAKYDPLTYDIQDPVECKLWKNASGSPFAA